MTEKVLSGKISRRDFGKLTAVTAVAVANLVFWVSGCKGGLLDSPTSTPPTLGNGLVPATPDIGETFRSTSLIETFKSLNIAVELPNPNWPISYQQVAETLKSNNGMPILTADKVTAIVETNQDGSRVWRGWYMAEPPFPLKPGINYDQKLGYHVDNANNPVFDPQAIFQTDWEKLPDDLKNNFAQQLIDIQLNNPGIAVFARTGGISRTDGGPPNTHYFLGTQEAEIHGIEQLSLIPVSAELCSDDIEKAASTRSFRQAALEFRDNRDAQEGNVTVNWFNPEKQNFEPLDGRMISVLAKQGRNLAVLETIPAGTPLSPEDLAKSIGGRPQNWVVDLRAWEWFYEAFRLKSGIKYVEGVGHVNESDKLLVGIEQTSAETSKVFDFSRIDPDALADFMSAPGNLPAVLFARVGEYPNDSRINNHSWYTWGGGNIEVGQKAIEQAALMIHDFDGCPVADMPTTLAGRAKTLAVEQPNPKVTALYWDGRAFITVLK